MKGIKLVREGGDSFGRNEMDVPSVPPHAEAEISIALNVPFTAGRYVSNWRLIAPNNQAFGPVLYVFSHSH